jgi:hypothetical protein
LSEALQEATLKRARALVDSLTSVRTTAASSARLLRRLETLLDVVYGLFAVQMLSYLPAVRDMSWVGRPLGLFGAMTGNGREIWRAVMGIGITAIAWCVGARRLSELRRTDLLHVAIVLLQTGIIFLFIYFAVCDPTLSGGPSSRALQCGSLVLASALGQLGWRYAHRRGFVDAATPPWQLNAVGARGRTETLTALLVMPLSWVGPVSWTLGWVVVPLLVTQVLPRLPRAGDPGPGSPSRTQPRKRG